MKPVKFDKKILKGQCASITESWNMEILDKPD